MGHQPGLVMEFCAPDRHWAFLGGGILPQGHKNAAHHRFSHHGSPKRSRGELFVLTKSPELQAACWLLPCSATGRARPCLHNSLQLACSNPNCEHHTDPGLTPLYLFLVLAFSAMHCIVCLAFLSWYDHRVQPSLRNLSADQTLSK